MDSETKQKLKRIWTSGNYKVLEEFVEELREDSNQEGYYEAINEADW